MTSLKWFLLLAAAGYLALMALSIWRSARCVFPGPASAFGGAACQAEEVSLPGADGVRVSAWHVPPREDAGRPHFQGNGGGLDLRAERFRKVTADGTGPFALNYRGYGSRAKPRGGNIPDARAALRFAAERYGANCIVLWGESLGTGVAVALAAEKPAARVILESPYTSIADVAASIYWFVPVRLLLIDSFRSDQRIAKVTVPVLVVHGERDTIVRIAFGERLYALIPGPKQFIRLPHAGHNDHDQQGMPEMVKPFLLGR